MSRKKSYVKFLIKSNNWVERYRDIKYSKLSKKEKDRKRRTALRKAYDILAFDITEPIWFIEELENRQEILLEKLEQSSHWSESDVKGYIERILHSDYLHQEPNNFLMTLKYNRLIMTLERIAYLGSDLTQENIHDRLNQIIDLIREELKEVE